jgi:enterochelin esterase family protein
MKRVAIVTFSIALVYHAILQATAWAQTEQHDSFFKLGPDSLPQENVPHGEIDGPHVLPSKVFEGTQHTYWVYVPAQYDSSKSCSLMIFQDGHAFMNDKGSARTTNVIDNLIYRREIPVMITVFINPGRRPDQEEPNAKQWGDGTTNRGEEYNSLDDRYARVIIDEVMPALYAKYNISKEAKDHGIGGCSSGAIAAFTVAWERPDQFSKVLSTVGSFTNIRGGHRYPDIIRDSPKKPIRVFFQDGRNDNRGQRRGGTYDPEWDWFQQNVRMVEAMTAKGYDVNYTWSIGKHSLTHGGVILPEMMRWLWRDHPVSTDVNDTVERAFHKPAVK